MRVHAIRTGTVAIKCRQVSGAGTGFVRALGVLTDREWTPDLPILAWVIEHPEGLIVVDTGETARSSVPGYFPEWHPYYRTSVRTNVMPDEEIGPQMRLLGLSPNDVRWVVLTHLHTDHAGGLHHFPHAEILVSRTEFQAASGMAGRLRGYLPHHWPGWFTPRLLDFPTNPHGPFPQSLPLTEAGDVILVSTRGHSTGQLSVIALGDEALFFAGDTSYTQQLMQNQVIDGVAPDAQAAHDTLSRIARYSEERRVVYLPTHDPESIIRLTARTIVPASPLQSNSVGQSA